MIKAPRPRLIKAYSMYKNINSLVYIWFFFLVYLQTWMGITLSCKCWSLYKGSRCQGCHNQIVQWSIWYSMNKETLLKCRPLERRDDAWASLSAFFHLWHGKVTFNPSFNLVSHLFLSLLMHYTHTHKWINSHCPLCQKPTHPLILPSSTLRDLHLSLHKRSVDGLF